MNKFDARVFCGVSFRNCIRIIGGSIVYDDDFKIVVGLVGDGIETTRKIFGSVVYWDNYRYKWIIFHW